MHNRMHMTNIMDLLGAEVGASAISIACLAFLQRESKVAQFGHISFKDEYVVGLHIAVDEAATVHVSDALHSAAKQLESNMWVLGQRIKVAADGSMMSPLENKSELAFQHHPVQTTVTFHLS